MLLLSLFSQLSNHVPMQPHICRKKTLDGYCVHILLVKFSNELKGYKLDFGFRVRVFERLGVQIFVQLNWFRVLCESNMNFRPGETSSAIAYVKVTKGLMNTLETITSGVSKYKALTVL